MIRDHKPLEYVSLLRTIKAEGAPDPTVTLPLSGREADELFDDLRAHFHAWTGQDIQHYRKST